MGASNQRGHEHMKKQTFGAMVAALRKEKGMTQLELAEKMGVTDKAVSKWERDLSFPDVSSIPKLAGILEVSVDELMQGKAAVNKRNKVAVLSSMLKGVNEEVQAKIAAAAEQLSKNGVEVVTIDAQTVAYAGAAWNILMSAELCNNVSRYDGVKYGYRTKNYTNIDELYTNSRTEAFGDFLKSAILFGSETLSTENYSKVYDKAMRVRRVIRDDMAAMLADCDALLMPAVSTLSYDRTLVERDKYLPYKENFFTAPASITGFPVVVAGGVQLVGNAFSEELLLDLAELV